MYHKYTIIVLSLISFLLSCSREKTQKNEFHEIITHTPQESIDELLAGNQRFLEDKLININHLEQIELTKHGHKPHAVILSCMDSRVPPEIIFDQGIGNIFVIRNAGNLEDHNVLGSLEYTVHVSTAKVIMVMGHSHCGAVTGALDDIKHGHLSQLVEQIKPSIQNHDSKKTSVIETAKQSVHFTIKDILQRSKTIRELVQQKKIELVGAFYDVETGEVKILEEYK